MTNYFYFKLFNNIKSEHEAKDFAKLELQSLFGEVREINNFVDVLSAEPLKKFCIDGIRIQDMIINELPYGRIQGYFGKKNDLDNINKLVKRLAYTKEIFIIMSSKKEPVKLLKEIFPDGVLDKNVQFFKVDDLILFRFITNQYFLEKSEYISKLSRNEKEIDSNCEVLFSYLTKQLYRIPASSSMAIGKRLEDYFAIREEPSLYLNHYMHPYKGKFHPKMVRALLNYIHPEDKGIVLDNFAGCGTLLVEAQYLGLNSYGVEINPLSALMSNIKCNSITVPLDKLKKAINEYSSVVGKEIKCLINANNKQKLLVENSLKPEKIREEARIALEEIKNQNGFKNKELAVQKIIIARELISPIKDKNIREFLLLSLSGAISDIARRTKNDFENVLTERMNDLYLRIYLFNKLNDTLKIKPASSETYTEDTRDIKSVRKETITGIINSPPYSTALDYIKNDYPQLVLLKLVDDMDGLERDMIGNPRKNYDKKELLEAIEGKKEDPLEMSPEAKKYVNLLKKGQREDAALRVYKFFVDMLDALNEMHKVLKNGAKAAIIIGNNHFQVNEKYVEIPNGRILEDIALKIGFKKDIAISRKLQKSSVGNIREEVVLVLEK